MSLPTKQSLVARATQGPVCGRKYHYRPQNVNIRYIITHVLTFREDCGECVCMCGGGGGGGILASGIHILICIQTVHGNFTKLILFAKISDKIS